MAGSILTLMLLAGVQAELTATGPLAPSRARSVASPARDGVSGAAPAVTATKLGDRGLTRRAVRLDTRITAERLRDIVNRPSSFEQSPGASAGSQGTAVRGRTAAPDDRGRYGRRVPNLGEDQPDAPSDSARP